MYKSSHCWSVCDMTREQALLGPLLDAREVVETFLAVRVEFPDWQPTLRGVAEELSTLSTSLQDQDLSSMAAHISTVADVGLRGHEVHARLVSSELTER